MQLLKPEVRNGLFSVPERAIFTKLRNSAPTVYAEGSKVTNSYVADGCVIEGTVENSIIFRGVHIGKGTVVKNSILLQDTFTGDNVSLNCVITDKNVVIRNDRVLSGHESMPFFISKGAMV
jgi:glucose-1-phosphate adenylyltransferase